VGARIAVAAMRPRAAQNGPLIFRERSTRDPNIVTDFWQRNRHRVRLRRTFGRMAPAAATVL